MLLQPHFSMLLESMIFNNILLCKLLSNAQTLESKANKILVGCLTRLGSESFKA